MKSTWLALVFTTMFSGLAAGRLAAQGDKNAGPHNLEKLNTEADEDDPHPSPLGLFYAGNKSGKFEILLSKGGAGANWAAGKSYLGSKDGDYRSPFVHAGTNTLFFATNELPDPKLAKLRNFDLKMKKGTMAPLPMIGISEADDELFPWLTPSGKEFYFSRKTEKGYELLVAKGPAFGQVGMAKSVGFPADFHHATLSGNGLTMYLQGPVEEGKSGIYRATRAKLDGMWSKPQAIQGLNGKSGKRGDLSPALSADGSRLYFVSDRDGGKGGLDIWTILTKDLKVE